MIEVTEAVKLARQFAADLFEGENIKNLGLEEVVFEESDNEWRITLGYDSHRVKTIETAPSSYSALSALAPSNIKKETLREYKTFRIGVENGDFKGMLIRDVG
ncbi:hypothetical protein [Psychrobacter vallis]|uniref:hypothetical protein n=1 Tax=Psychrobacter vallis TaxID=248451 RepID=UPI00191B13B0|nr:hypothetical protein [Psychrobacter vallis]